MDHRLTETTRDRLADCLDRRIGRLRLPADDAELDALNRQPAWRWALARGFVLFAEASNGDAWAIDLRDGEAVVVLSHEVLWSRDEPVEAGVLRVAGSLAEALDAAARGALPLDFDDAVRSAPVRPEPAPREPDDLGPVIGDATGDLDHLDRYVRGTRIQCDAGREDAALEYVRSHFAQVAEWAVERILSIGSPRPEPAPPPAGVRVAWGEWGEWGPGTDTASGGPSGRVPARELGTPWTEWLASIGSMPDGEPSEAGPIHTYSPVEGSGWGAIQPRRRGR